jgi:predicted AAA+ superfamily ATPase
MVIARRAFSKLNELLGRFPAVVLLGPRQVGKTTLAKQCAAEREGIYLDLESQRDLSKLSDPEDYLSQREDKLVILDEIQRVPELFLSLRGLIDEGRSRGLREGRFFLLGSASLELIQQSSETLAGRIVPELRADGTIRVDMGPPLLEPAAVPIYRRGRTTLLVFDLEILW